MEVRVHAGDQHAVIKGQNMWVPSRGDFVTMGGKRFEVTDVAWHLPVLSTADVTQAITVTTKAVPS